MSLDRSDWTWAAGYTVGGLLGIIFVAIGTGPYESGFAIVLGSLVYLFLSGAVDE